MKNILCRAGAHAWQQRRNPDGEAYRSCRLCGKDGEQTGAITAARVVSRFGAWP